ncbi:MAG: hypothetical protein ACUVTZ_08495 [Armatimonadota bacterium]
MTFGRAFGLLVGCGLAAAVLCVCASAAQDYLRPSPPPRRCLVLFTPSLSLRDLSPDSMPAVRLVLHSGAVGLMNTRVAAVRRRNGPTLTVNPEATADPFRGGAYLTIGAGTRCYGGPLAGEALALTEANWEGVAPDVYRRRCLWDVPPGQVLQPNARTIQARNVGLGYRTRPGCLAELLASVRVRTAVVGSADRSDERLRDAVLTAMLASGVVPEGQVTGLSVHDPIEPFGLKDDTSKLARTAAKLLEPAPKELGRVVFLDWGDPARLDDYLDRMTPAAAFAARRRMLSRLDQLLDVLVGPSLRRKPCPGSPWLDFQHDFFVWLVPHPSRAARASQDTLTPIAVVGPGFPSGSLLTSPATRRPGVVANTDVAPTIAGWFGAGRDPTMVGRPIGAIAISHNQPSDAFQTLVRFSNKLSLKERQRRTSISTLLRVMQASMLVLALMWLTGLSSHIAALGRRGPAGLLILATALVPMAIPPAAMIIAPLPLPSVNVHGLALAVCIAALSFTAAGVCRALASGFAGPALLSALTASLVIADGVRGFQTLPFSVMGYSIPDGSRYYGIGNEMMGAFVTAVLLTAAAVMSPIAGTREVLLRWRRLAALALYVLATAVLVVPTWGAKFGGALTAGIGFTMAAAWAYGYRIRGRVVALCLAAAVTAVAAMVALDIARGGHGSHVGMLYRAVREGGPTELVLVAQRKFGMNMRLLVFSPWSRLLGLCILSAVAFWWDGWRRRTHPVWPEGPLGQALKASIVSAAVAFVVDDAGVLAAATGFVLIPPLLFSYHILLGSGHHAARPTGQAGSSGAAPG